MPPTEIVLEVRNARKAFGQLTALDGAAFQLHAGELLALLGPNGAGKTTLIRAICGRTRLDQGTIVLQGLPLQPDDDRSALGFVPQDIALYGDLTPRENLEIFGRLHGVRGGLLHERVALALEWTGLADRDREQVQHFSGGMKRRLNVACAVLHRPQVILLDEPTVGVDPQSRERIFDMLAELRSDGASILLTTHQLDEAESRCDRIVVFDRGRVVASGTLSELIAATVGTGARAILRLECHSPAAPDEFQPTTDPQVVTCPLADPAADVPRLFAQLQAAGCRVADFDIERPSLHAVFLHLTGRELRE
ncbi:MAG: ABC transporter ATP-binding protein [Planctomycetales bacterium]